MGKFNEAFESVVKGIKRGFKKDVTEATEKYAFSLEDRAAEELKRGVKKVEQAQSDIHLNRQKEYDDMFNSNNIADQMTYNRKDVVSRTENGLELNNDGFKKARKEMIDRYNTLYDADPAKSTISRRKAFEEYNKVETESNASIKQKAWNMASKIDNAKRVDFEKLQQEATKKYGVNGTNKPKPPQPGKIDNFLKQAIPIAVGGGLVFSMFNRGGQMSNSELYGQQNSYSY